MQVAKYKNQIFIHNDTDDCFGNNTYIIQCTKPGISYGTSVKTGRYLASENVKQAFTKNINTAKLFKSLEDAKYHIKLFLSTSENTALFHYCKVKIQKEFV